MWCPNDLSEDDIERLNETRRNMALQAKTKEINRKVGGGNMKLSEKIVEALFTNGTGETAQRLVLEMENKIEGGGWCKAAVIKVIDTILHQSSE